MDPHDPQNPQNPQSPQNPLYASGFRGQSHAGQWYTSNAPQLAADLSGWLSLVRPMREGEEYPVRGCKAIIAPHAGYAYCGETAAWAYKSIDPSTTQRVFILGPSHAWAIRRCALTRCHTFSTPLGRLPVDMVVLEELAATGLFDRMNIIEDEKEHSIEMQLPYLRRVCEGKEIQIVPILVGEITKEQELQYGRLLAPYLAEEGTVFIISTDFCHWGPTYDYMFYFPKPNCPIADAYEATRALPTVKGYKIWESTTQLDHIGMGILADKDRSAFTAHRDFTRYLQETGNTICGRHPIGILYGALGHLEETTGRKKSCTWVKYDQSFQATRITDNSVSYASAWIKI